MTFELFVGIVLGILSLIVGFPSSRMKVKTGDAMGYWQKGQAQGMVVMGLLILVFVFFMWLNK